MDSSTASRESRRHYRVRYPQRLRPRLELEGVFAAVIDISEGGVRVVNESQLPVTLGAAVNGLLRLRSGECVRLSGSVVRVTMHDVALSLGQGISCAITFREQRLLRIRRRYFG